MVEEVTREREVAGSNLIGRIVHKKLFAEKSHTAKVPFADVCLPCATHDKHFAMGKMAFAVCPWHTAKGLSTVVIHRALCIAKYVPHSLSCCCVYGESKQQIDIH